VRPCECSALGCSAAPSSPPLSPFPDCACYSLPSPLPRTGYRIEAYRCGHRRVWDPAVQKWTNGIQAFLNKGFSPSVAPPARPKAERPAGQEGRHVSVPPPPLVPSSREQVDDLISRLERCIGQHFDYEAIRLIHRSPYHIAMRVMGNVVHKHYHGVRVINLNALVVSMLRAAMEPPGTITASRKRPRD
jgi:hypothetical protein